MTSSMPDPRMLFADVSPITHLKDSTIFDFPQPFGPTIPVKPFSIKKLVLSANTFTGPCFNKDKDSPPIKFCIPPISGGKFLVDITNIN